MILLNAHPFGFVPEIGTIPYIAFRPQTQERTTIHRACGLHTTVSVNHGIGQLHTQVSKPTLQEIGLHISTISIQAPLHFNNFDSSPLTTFQHYFSSNKHI